MKIRYWKLVGILLFLVLLPVLLAQPSETKAGIFDASSEVTYKEYWVDHTQFTGGCGDNEKPFGSWYLEPYGCEKTVYFQIEDDISQALKAEIYLDLWRNHDSKLARFSINGGALYAPNVGSDWSRTPYVGPVALSDLGKGNNNILFKEGGYHLHDIAIRIYYDESHPLIAGSGSDVTPPDGSLLTIQGDGAALAAGAGGNLQVDNNQLTLTADVSNGAKYVEFHSYYFGADEDNDGQFRDWHNRGRNNLFPGGVAEKPTGGTIDHPGTKATPSDGQYSVNWDVSTVPDQGGVKFKIRVVDDAGNVREAAGGVSNEFTLSRNKPLIAFWNANFGDYGLYMEGTRPSSVSTKFRMPVDYNFEDFETGKIVHSFWHGAVMNFNNGSKDFWPAFIDDDMWQMSIVDINPIHLWKGVNKIEYWYNNPVEGRPGAFVEKPGPMFILQRAAWINDFDAPSIYNPVPMRDQVDVGAGTSIQLQLVDDKSGLDYSTILMKVQDETVTPSVSGAKHSAVLSYWPPLGFEDNEVVDVAIEVCDLDGNCLNDSYSFKVEGESLPTGIVSDDFNSCTLDETVWDFRDPVGNVDFNVTGAAFEFIVPAGSNHDLWKDANTAPRIMQPAADVDFRISARFNSAVDKEAQMQGFIVAEDDNNFLRFSMRYGGGTAGEGVYLEAYIFENGIPTNMINVKLGQSKPYVVPTDLGVQRIGNLWKFLYVNEGQEWEEVGRFEYIPNLPFPNNSFDVTEVGVFAGNKGQPASQAPAFTSSIDFFFDDADPIDPQDQDPLYLPVEIVGGGSVEKAPSCGNPVTLTATPDEGYFFSGWSSKSGAISGRTNPLNTSYVAGEEVTATFVLDELTLDVDVVNNGSGEGGSVSISPDKAVYNFDEQVVLTPIVPDGWEFMGWSGDVKSGDENKNPLIVTMDNNLSITATFAAEPVTLETDVVGKGSVIMDPDQSGNYHYGDIVKLTAVPDSGWVFSHWEGGETSSNTANPADFVLNGDTSVTAVFKTPDVFLPFIGG